MLNRIKICLIAGLLWAGLAQAQLTDDPSAVPVPPETFADPARAVVIQVQFDTATSVSPVDVFVANTRAPSSIANPNQLLVELIDHKGQVIGEQFAHHPLWVRDIDDQGQETGSILHSGPATFFVPLSETLRSVRISDVELDQELITVDVSTEVLTYCNTVPQTPICALFLDGFE